MQRRGFTLIETLISLAIVIIVLAGAVSFSRSFFVTGQVSEDRAQAEGLVDDALGLLVSLQRTVRSVDCSPAPTCAVNNLSTFLYVDKNDTTAYVIPYRVSNDLFWCAVANQDADRYRPGGCNLQVSKVGNLNLGTMLKGTGELIGVNRAAWGVADEGESSPLVNAVFDATTTLGDPITTSDKRLDYYKRVISLQKSTLSGITMHTAKVTVTNTRTNLSVTKSIVLSDE